mgnify:CR=1 FL=1
MVSDEALKKLQEQIAAYPMTQRFVVQQLIRDYLRNREDLRAYEDTGLEPEQCKNAKVIIESAFSDDTAKAERIRELLKADKDGRLVVLPCKVGDTVWITGSVRRLYSEKVRTFFCGDPSYSRGMADNGVKMMRTTGCDIPIHEFGKTVFLTREEAEKALEAMME